MIYLTSLLAGTYEKAHFSCGNEMLDGYLHKQAKQDMKRKLSACFVLSDDGKEIKGYYTLSSASIQRSQLPESIIKKLPPSYNDLPVTLLGRLAVDVRFKGQGIGKLLLIDALKRSYETSMASIASMAIVVDPIDDAAINFYSKYGFILLPGSGRMFITMNTVEQLF
ncbi:MAG: GNAT family N-acetyltransferase [Chitinophagales bacterium]